MHSRTAAHVLQQIAAYLELKGENRFKIKAYETAAKGLLALVDEDLSDAFHSGELGKVRGLGPATLAVVRDLIETGESRYLEQLRETMPEGLLEMLRIPGLGPEKIRKVHEALGVETVDELERAAIDGRLTSIPKWGPKTVERILKGIAFLRESGKLVLFIYGAIEARRLLAMVLQHPGVQHAEIAGSIRRRREVVQDVDIVAACVSPPQHVTDAFARIGGVREARPRGSGCVRLVFVDGTHLDLYCVMPDHFATALWRATGSNEHVALVRERLASRGLTLDEDTLRDASGCEVPVPSEAALFEAAGMSFVEPELREARGEIAAATSGVLPRLVELEHIQGVLHCHSHYSDGKASVAEMARAAKDRGWSYIGITDHSEAAFYAGGLSKAKILAQHEEIDGLNATLDGVRVLKGIEADILADGRLDYGPELLSTFDFVIGSIHSRFGMDATAMTRRVLTALDDPHLTILAHPTGRLLLNRDPYGIDLEAVVEKAAAVGVAVELNADPHRLDLDWRHLHAAKQAGATIEIGPDAHSVRGLDVMEIGVGIARKGWLERRDILNAGSADDVLAFARRRRGRV
jgi:DNA polymerase (family 10)